VLYHNVIEGEKERERERRKKELNKSPNGANVMSINRATHW
jgi:hypothetical protein